MSLKSAWLLGILSLLLVVTTGCASAKPKTTASKSIITSSSAPVVIKKPVEKNPVYEFCEKGKNEIIIRFDAETQSSKAYCRFADATECPAADYYAGTCSSGKNSQAYQKSLTTVSATEACTQVYQPVCGIDKITYTNECVAQIQGVKIAQTGVCPPAPPVTASPAVSPTDNTQPIVTPSIEKSPETSWQEIIKNFIQAQPLSSPAAHLDRCLYNGQTVYLEVSGCPLCSSILYSEAGNIICYPDHDFNNTCPGFSPAKARCVRSWTDNR